MNGALSQRWIAWLMRHAMAPYERRVAVRKQRLFADAGGGLAIEIGCGMRANAAYLPQGLRWIGTDPNRHMRPPVCAAAERLPFPTASADIVIATLVLCSVRQPAACIAEIRRVLKPDGRFLFLEHVAAPPGTRMRRAQRWLHPVCRACADGCSPLRDTGPAIRAAGFANVAMEEFTLGLPHISGCAVR